METKEEGPNGLREKTQLAWNILCGCGGEQVDEDSAVVLLEEQVKDMDQEAMWMLGLCHEYGLGCEQDISYADSLYKRSVDHGSEVGKILVGNKKNRGTGTICIPRMNPKSLRLLLFAAPWRIVSMNGEDSTEEEVSVINEALKKSSTITALHLKAEKELGDEKAKILSEALSSNTSLTSLDLYSNVKE